MKMYNFNYCPLRFAHLVGNYRPGDPCPECGYGGEVDFVAYDDVNMNVPPYGSLPSDLEDISFVGLMHAGVRFRSSYDKHPSSAEDWTNAKDWNGDVGKM